MMRSMYSGVSGLRTHQTKMDVIANNISNVNTVGFKSSRVTFNEVFSQTLSGASAANDNTGRGGTNTMQIGLGSGVASIDTSMTTGASQRTDNALDLMVNGDGFFIVADATGTYFTRAGAFTRDASGYLVNPSGYRLQGWDIDANGNIVKDQVSDIQIKDEKLYITPTATTEIAFAGNLNPSTSTSTTPVVSSVSFFDSIGNRYTTEMTTSYAVVGGVGTWTSTIGSTAWPAGEDSTSSNTIAVNPATVTYTFNTTGLLNTINAGTGATVSGNIVSFAVPATLSATFGNGANPGVISIDFSNLTQFGSDTTSAKCKTVNGNAAGSLQSISVGADGKISGSYTNGEYKLIGQIPVAVFMNPAGLQSMGGNLYQVTPNSGDFDGEGVETGDLMAGVLEMSNVDLSSEFTEMITTQRGFQANSRIITTSDEILQELVNLKR